MSVRDPQKTKEDPERIEPQRAADPELIALISEGDRAFDRFEHTAALEAYTQALAWEPAEALPDQERIRLLIRRAQTYRALGNRAHQIKDCLELEPLARRVNTAEVMAEAAIWFADLSLTTAVRGDALELAEDAVEMARASGQRELEARALTALGMMYGNMERFEQAEATLQEALALFEETDEHFARADCLIYLSMAPSARSGPRSEELSFQALDIVRRSGDRRREARVLLFISGRVDDAATGRRHAEAALALAEELGLVEVTAQAYNHLSLIYMSLGLYSTADFYAQGSIDIARKGNNHGLLGATLESEGRIRMGMQDLPGAERAFQESLDLSKQLGIKDWIGINKLGLARLALEQGDVESADALAEEAIQLFRDVNRSHGLAHALAFLAEVRLAQRNWKAALKLASEATQVARSSGALSEEFHPQAVWWTYYRVLKAHPKRRKYLDTKDHSKGTLKEEAHAALQRAFELAQASVGDVSDEGLRRSYWNKVAVNRQILFELAQEETTKDWTPQLIEAQERTDLQEQLRRMLQIGVRMNQIREPDRLIRFVMDQLIELSGAERAAWIVRSADERLSLRAKRGFADDEEALGHTALLLGKETHTHRPILRQAVSDQDPTKDPDGLLDSQSVMVVPLAEPGGGHAWLYAENHTLFGQFTEADVTLISAFANQVAAALDNATLYQDLERRVAERTSELEQANAALEDRAAELSIINEVQRALASTLEIQEIFELVGEQISQLFPGKSVSLYTGGKDAELAHARYMIEDGERHYPPPIEPGPIARHLLDTRRSIMISTRAEFEEIGAVTIEGTQPSASGMYAPMVVGGEILGMVFVESSEQENAFTESDLAFLTTLADSLSLALENARLFNETARLLKETEQRAAELQIINSVQRGLASELDLQSIYQLIGERLRVVFNVETVLIAFHDEEADRVVIPYYNDRGNVITTQIRPYGQGKLFESIVESGRPALFNTRDAVSAAQTTDVASPGSEADLNNSLLAVPIFREGKVVGITSVQSYQENAFDENDVALLQALTNSMSIALENARLLDETSRLLEESQQRATELGIINNVGQALVKKMEFDAILELVGERLRDIFNADTTYIMLYEPEGQIVNPAYYVDRGQRIKLPSQKITQSLNKVIVESREPLLTGTMEESQELGALLIPSDGEKDLNQSFLGVPFFSGDQVAGVISVQSYEKYMYDESDVRLLVTLASSMSVALENARLFEETTHLLDETRRRNAELAVINSIQEGLGSKLDIQAIFELVGDKIREIFDAQVVAISTFDPETGTETWPYIIERGERLEVEPGPTYGFSGHMVETLEPLMINENMDERLEEFGVVIMAGEPAKSYLGVPLVVRGQPKGVINLQNIDHEHAFSDTDMRLLTTIAASTSVALENAQLFEETSRLLEESQQRAAELSLINNIGAALSKKLDFDAILELIGERLREIFQADTIYIMPYDAKQEVASLTYYVDQGERIEFPTNSTPQGLAKLIVDTKEPLLLGTKEEATKLGSPRVLPADGVDRNESFLGVPYFSGEEVAGVVSVQRYQQHAFDESDLRLLSTIASSMSVALENAQLFEETHNLLDDARQRNTELAAINTVSQALVAEAEIDNLIELIGEQVRSAFQADIAYVALLDSRANMIRFPYLHGEELEPIPYGEGLTSQILQSGEPLLINQDMDGAIAEMQTERIGIAAASYLGVPITVGQLAIGVISVQSTREEGRFGEADVRLLSTIAANAGAAIRNAQLLAETKRRASEMAALNEIGREASASLDLPVVLDSITRRARSMLSAESSAVILLDEDGSTLRPIAAAGDMAEEVMNFTWNLGEGIIGDTVLHGRAERISDTASDPRAIHIEGTSQEVPNEKLMVAPLFAREKVIGAMAVWRGAATEVFDDDDLSFLTGLSQQAGASIHNARLFEEIQRQKQYMEAVVQNSPVAIVTVDRDFHVVSWNPAAEKLFGYTEEEAIGRDAHELHSKDEEVLAEAHGFSEQIASGERVQAITRRTRKDGSFVDVELMGVPVVVGGEQVGNIIIYHDLSELKQAEAALLEQKEYLQAVVSNSPVAIVTADQRGRIVSWNPAAETLFGYEAEEAIGQEIDALIASADREMQAEAAEFTDQAQHGRLHVQTKRARKDGTLVDVELLGVPVTVDGAQAGIIAIYHDITELKRAMHEAEAANEAKSAFLATMSHEIRTPMNAVIGMSGLLLDTDLDEEQQEFAEIIRNSSDALLTIINDILDFSKIEAGKMELEDQPFNIRECVEGTLDLVASRAYEKGLDLAYYIEEGAPAWLVGDVTRFRQILLNLLTNAVKFTDAGEVMVTVGADDEESRKHNGRPLESGEHFLHVVVRDTGIGIPPDRMDRLFQSFSQLDASTARKYGGTGLGLAISKRLAEMMGGAMWAESELGVGTRFHFTIRGLEAEGSSQESTLDTPDSTLQGRRVLIVDDNDTNRRILSLHVKSWGMLPRDTHSPMVALEWVQEGEPFDVAILDMHMPEYDGLSLARGIRKTEAGKQLPLILFTSLGRREIETEDIEFESYLTKPIKPSQLLDALTVVFAGRPSRIQQPRADHFKPDPELGNRHPLRILLAEDNAVNQKLALRLLDQMGYRADVAGNGQEVLDSLARQEYDVVLMDVQMPEMDGLEASRRINQRWDQDERPRIIAMTANAMQGDRERCLAAGMDDYVSKPVRVHELMDALERSPINRHGER